MAMFGSNRNRDPFRILGDLPDYYKMSLSGMAGQPVEDLYSPEQAPAPAQAGHGFFDKGGAGRGIAGTIGDVLLQRAHMQPIYAPAMQQQRETEMRMQQYQQQRQDTMADWKTQQQWERDHPKPSNNDTVADYNFIRETRGQKAADSFLDNRAYPTRYLEVEDPATGGKRIVPVGGPPGSPSGTGQQDTASPPPSAIEFLKQHPETAPLFEGKYKTPASQFLGNGGAGSTAPRTFPGWRR